MKYTITRYQITSDDYKYVPAIHLSTKQENILDIWLYNYTPSYTVNPLSLNNGYKNLRDTLDRIESHISKNLYEFKWGPNESNGNPLPNIKKFQIMKIKHTFEPVNNRYYDLLIKKRDKEITNRKLLKVNNIISKISDVSKLNDDFLDKMEKLTSTIV